MKCNINVTLNFQNNPKKRKRTAGRMNKKEKKTKESHIAVNMNLKFMLFDNKLVWLLLQISIVNIGNT